MPSKKKKYNARFPPARIKKIMQTDDEIGKVAAAVPVLISKSLEMFLTSILLHTGDVTKAKQAKTMSTSHLKECIFNVSMFDFLKEVVADVPDMQNEDEPTTSGSALSSSEDVKKLSRKRNATLHSKHPTKSAKMSISLQSTSEDNESAKSGCDASDEDSAHNAGSSHDQSPSVPSQAMAERVQASDRKPSYHFPVEKLISVHNEPPVNANSLLQVVTPEEKRKARVSKPDSTDLHLITNGLSPQKPMDLSVNVRGHTNASKTTGVVGTEVSHVEPPVVKQQGTVNFENIGSDLQSSVFDTQHKVATSVINPHVYTPHSILSPPVSNASEKDVKRKNPPGGTLSFMYSSYPGDSSLSSNASSMSPNASSIANPAHLRPVSHINRTIPGKSRVDEPDLAYPYNPVAEHHRKLNSLAPHPYLPPSSYQASCVKPNTSHHNAEDDDYDV